MIKQVALSLTSGVASLIVSLIAAWLLDIDDLALYSMLSFAFAVHISMISWPIRSLLLNRPKHTKVAWALFVGASLAYLWTLAFMFFLLGFQFYFIKAFSIPFFHGWIFGGIAGSLTIAFAPILGKVMLSPQSKSLLGCSLLFPFMLGIGVFAFLALHGLITNKEKMFLIPEGYVGPVLIVYAQSNGQPPKYEGDVQLFEIPPDGVLITQSPKPDGIGDEFWYVNESGQRTKKLIFNQSCVTTVPDDPVIVCVKPESFVMNGEEMPRHDTLTIGPQSQQHELAQWYREWKRDIMLSLFP